MPEEVDRSTCDEAGTVPNVLGTGLYLCGLCDMPVETQSTRYRCAGHIMRSREHVDEFILNVVRARLGMEDVHDLLPSQDEPRIRALKKDVDQQRGETIRARRDYDIVSAFDNLDPGAQRAVIDVLCEVRLYPHPHGVKAFNPETVQIKWR